MAKASRSEILQNLENDTEVNNGPCQGSFDFLLHLHIKNYFHNVFEG